jgi:hypothetical protein
MAERDGDGDLEVRASLTNDDRAIYRIRAWIDEAMHGTPMGSGVTEGACKSLISARTKRCGQRWQKRGIESVFALRWLSQTFHTCLSAQSR